MVLWLLDGGSVYILLGWFLVLCGLVLILLLLVSVKLVVLVIVIICFCLM